MALSKKAVVSNTLWLWIGFTNAIHIYFNSSISFSANAVLRNVRQIPPGV